MHQGDGLKPVWSRQLFVELLSNEQLGGIFGICLQEHVPRLCLPDESLCVMLRAPDVETTCGTQSGTHSRTFSSKHL